jgi:hypothetical protein
MCVGTTDFDSVMLLKEPFRFLIFWWPIPAGARQSIVTLCPLASLQKNQHISSSLRVHKLVLDEAGETQTKKKTECENTNTENNLLLCDYSSCKQQLQQTLNSDELKIQYFKKWIRIQISKKCK